MSKETWYTCTLLAMNNTVSASLLHGGPHTEGVVQKGFRLGLPCLRFVLPRTRPPAQLHLSFAQVYGQVSRSYLRRRGERGGGGGASCATRKVEMEARRRRRRRQISRVDSRGLEGLYLLGICHVLAPLRERRERKRESLLVYSIMGVSL